MVSVPEEPSEAVIGRSQGWRMLLWRGNSSLPLSPLERTGQVVSLAGDTIRLKALDFPLDHPEIASESEVPQGGRGSSEEVSEPPEHGRAEERA